jgi:hypothetical protein
MCWYTALVGYLLYLTSSEVTLAGLLFCFVGTLVTVSLWSACALLRILIDDRLSMALVELGFMGLKA